MGAGHADGVEAEVETVRAVPMVLMMMRVVGMRSPLGAGESRKVKAKPRVRERVKASSTAAKGKEVRVAREIRAKPPLEVA